MCFGLGEGKVLYPMQKKLTLKARQKISDSPPELITQYKVVAIVFRHYSLPLHHRPAIPNEGTYTRLLRQTIKTQLLTKKIKANGRRNLKS